MQVILFYRYIKLTDVSALVEHWRERLQALGMNGRLLVAEEGYNGTLSGTLESVEQFKREMEEKGVRGVDWKCTPLDDDAEHPFISLSVRKVGEIISCGAGAGPNAIAAQVQFDESTFGGLAGTGVHLDPLAFHDKVQQVHEQKGILLDIRNDFESSIGHFEGAIPVNTTTYSQSWRAIDDILAANDADAERTQVAMYCTGGIRCEKASAYLKSRGFKQVFQLAGGIHRYLEAPLSKEDSLWRGKNFVFDARVRVGQGQGQVDENEDENAVMGQCVDCAAPHDQYSGKVSCTVCRQPVLCCPSCVATANPPDEYHCPKHRHLKHVYFTILDSFSDADLERQRGALLSMEEELLALKQQGKNKRRTLRRQADKVEEELARRRRGETQQQQVSSRDAPHPMSKEGRGFWKKEKK